MKKSQNTRTDAETRALRRVYRALTEDAPEDNERCAAAESLRRAFPGLLWDRPYDTVEESKGLRP